MLESSWETHATLISNAATSAALVEVLDSVVASLKIDLSKPALVVYGHDTRSSCPSLVKSLKDGLDAAGAQTVEAGLKTTPQLHYLVRAINTKGTVDSYGEPSEDGYYKKLAAAFKTLVTGKTPLSTPLTVDASNGVGAPKFRRFLEAVGDSPLSIKIVFDDTNTPGALNNGCGADFVKTNQKAPQALQLVSGNRYCSFDGDADRIVYYYQAADGTFRLLDGDKIATLAAMHIIDLVKQAGVELDVGVVQTAYANGSSNTYITKVLVCSQTFSSWCFFSQEF
jgi:phosphoacetylglucosamine mutase